MDAAFSDPDDRLLAREIFGTDDLDRIHGMLRDWVRDQGFGAAAVTDIEMSIGAGVTVALAGGDRMFVKVWPGTVDARALGARMEVQRRLHERGFGAPAVLTAPRALGPGWAVAMGYDRSGTPTDATRPGVRRAMAAGLARLIEQADDLRDLPGLPQQVLPSGDAIWPRPHNVLFDFATTTQGAERIDALAADALAILRSARGRLVVGHDDWSAKNMRMGDDGIAVVYDWDAVLVAPETLILGAAAAHFPMTWELDVPETPPVAEVTAFVRDYEAARGNPFTRGELAEVGAAATYARAYKARCEHAIDPDRAAWPGSSRESLETYGAFGFD